MPVENVIRLIDSLQLESDAINTWKAGVVRALKKYANNLGDSDEPPTSRLMPKASILVFIAPVLLQVASSCHGVMGCSLIEHRFRFTSPLSLFS